MGILQKIETIQREVGTIAKNGKGPSTKGGFEYVKYEDVALKVRDLMIDNSVVVQPRTLSHTVKSEQVGTRMVVNTSILVEYTFIDVETGEKFETTFGGEGSDIGGDTATRKAYTQAEKIRDLQTFKIFTGEEPDSDGAEQAELPVADPIAKAAESGKETVDSLRARIGKIIGDENSPYDSEVVNQLGDEVTGKVRDKWFNTVTDLKKVLDALEKGQLPS